MTSPSDSTLVRPHQRRKAAVATMRGLGGLVMLSLGIAMATTQAAWAQSTERVSISSNGLEANTSSSDPAISADGRFVAFESSASSLISTDTNNADDVYVRDRANGTTRRVSVTDNELQANGSSFNPDISADGRFVVFESDATNLIAGDTNGRTDVFIRDLANETTRRVSVTDDELEANDDNYSPAISADGRFVVFGSAATNLIAGDTNDRGDVFIRDLPNGTTRRISVTDTELQANGASAGPAISRDGRFVAFQSSANNLIANDTNVNLDSFGVDIFIRDRAEGTTRRVSVTDDGREADRDSRAAAISADGRFVAFNSKATNLVAGDTNTSSDVFIRDRASGTTRRVSVTDNELQANSDSVGPVVSNNGQFVAFQSEASNLLGNNDTNGVPDVFVRDRTNALTRFASVTNTTGGGLANGASEGRPAISGDGRFVAFTSAAANLVVGDANGHADIFVRDRGAFGATTRVTVALADKRIPARGPLRVLVENGNRFEARVVLSAATTKRVAVGERRRRVALRSRKFMAGGNSRSIVEMSLPRTLRQLLRRNGELSLRLTAKVTGPAGKIRTVGETVVARLKRPPRP